MSQQYPGGFITKSPPATVGPVDGEGGSAPGVWTLDQAMTLNKQGLWPKPVLPRRLYSWGAGLNGQLGLNDTSDRSSPVQVGALTNWAQVGKGTTHSVALKTDGTMWAWGSNNDGELGQNNRTYRSSPVQIGSLTTWTEVSCGYNNSFAIKTDGTLWCWGRNNNGELGIGDVYKRSSPVQIGALTNWSKISASKFHCIARKTDGTIWSWGYDGSYSGQLGLNTTFPRSSPVQIGALTTWASVSTATNSSFAIKTDGTMWSWGRNLSGVLGLSRTPDFAGGLSSPVQIGALTTWSKVAGANYFCSAIKTDGTLWMWGRNNLGQLGQDNATYRSSPVQVGALTNWAQTSGGEDACLALKTDGTLWSWGRNNVGQLGQNDTTDRSSPVQIGASTTWSVLAKSVLSLRGSIAITKG